MIKRIRFDEVKEAYQKHELKPMRGEFSYFPDDGAATPIAALFYDQMKLNSYPPDYEPEVELDIEKVRAMGYNEDYIAGFECGVERVDIIESLLTNSNILLGFHDGTLVADKIMEEYSD